MLISARVLKNVRQPCRAAKPVVSAMAIGPEIFFSDTSPVTIRPTIRSVKTEVSQVLATACAHRVDRAVLL